jgi:hypothetical protein
LILDVPVLFGAWQLLHLFVFDFIDQCCPFVIISANPLASEVVVQLWRGSLLSPSGQRSGEVGAKNFSLLLFSEHTGLTGIGTSA